MGKIRSGNKKFTEDMRTEKLYGTMIRLSDNTPFVFLEGGAGFRLLVCSRVGPAVYVNWVTPGPPLPMIYFLPSLKINRKKGGREGKKIHSFIRDPRANPEAPQAGSLSPGL
jgi:hypothetical protein